VAVAILAPITVAAYWAGSYAINLVGYNMINNHMSLKEAFRQTPFVVGMSWTIPYNVEKPPSSSQDNSGTGISDADLDNFYGSKDITSDWQQGGADQVWGRDGGYLGSSIDNFLGITNLTASKVTWNNTYGPYWGGIRLQLEYTSLDMSTDYRWIQKVSRNGNEWYYDNEGSNSIAYYSDSQLTNNITGNTLLFYDYPRTGWQNEDRRLVLSLWKGDDRIFAIYYGYTIRNGICFPHYPTVLIPRRNP